MWEKIKPYILIFPSILVIGTLFIGGLFFGILQSFGLFRISEKSSFTLEFYYKLLSSKDFMEAVAITLKVAIIATLISGLLAIMISAALFLFKNKYKSRLLSKILYLPIVFPHIIAAYLVLIMFMKSGWLSSVLYSLGLTDSMASFPTMVNDNSSIGIILTYVWKETPFILLMLAPVIYRVKNSWMNIARSLGASKLSFFKEVVLKIITPTLISSMLIVFAFTFSDFEVPYFLGTTYPKFLAVYSYQLYYNGYLSERPLALAANFILTIIMVIIGFIAYKISKKYSFDKAIKW